MAAYDAVTRRGTRTCHSRGAPPRRRDPVARRRGAFRSADDCGGHRAHARPDRDRGLRTRSGFRVLGTRRAPARRAADQRRVVPRNLNHSTQASAERPESGVVVEWLQGDMKAFDLGRTFDLVFITANSLLHLHESDDLVSCFRSVRRHLAPGARFVFDVFNPSMRVLADADGVRRTRESLSFTDPDRGRVRVDVAETYDALAQVTRGTWHLWTDSAPDMVVAPLEIRSIFPQELPLLVSLGGLRLVERFGDWSGGPFSGESPLQICVCESA